MLQIWRCSRPVSGRGQRDPAILAGPTFFDILVQVRSGGQVGRAVLCPPHVRSREGSGLWETLELLSAAGSTKADLSSMARRRRMDFSTHYEPRHRMSAVHHSITPMPFPSNPTQSNQIAAQLAIPSLAPRGTSGERAGERGFLLRPPPRSRPRLPGRFRATTGLPRRRSVCGTKAGPLSGNDQTVTGLLRPVTANVTG